MFRRIEALLDPTGPEPSHHRRRVLSDSIGITSTRRAGWRCALFIVGGLIAVLDTTIPTFIGRVVALVSTHTPDTLLRECWRELLGMAIVHRPGASADATSRTRSSSIRSSTPVSPI